MMQCHRRLSRCTLFGLVTLVMMAGLPGAAWGKVAAASVFGSHMVLQQGMEVPVWGTADAGQQVTVSFAGQKVTTQADANGKWMVRLASLKATAGQKGQSLTIQGQAQGDVVRFDDVLIGEVWLCSGQSNMQWPMRRYSMGPRDAKEANLPEIRLLQVELNNEVRQPVDTIKGSWEICTPDIAINFSAVAFYYGRELYQALGVPIGLIHSSEGGSIAETWVSSEALLKNLPELEDDYRNLVYPGKVLDQRLVTQNAQAHEREQSIVKLIELENDIAASTKMAATDFDDSSWKTLDLPGSWPRETLGGFHGMLYVRKTIDVPAAWAGKDIVLKLGTISTVDVTWFNGQLVGQTNRMSEASLDRFAARQPTPVREYRVEGKYVKAEKNVVTVRVINLHSVGGVTLSGNHKLQVQLADGSEGSVPLDGQWRYLDVHKLSQIPIVAGGSNRPSVLFSGMINPLIPYALRGAIWYQGEFNVKRADRYRLLLSTLITDWRTRWGQQEYSFIIVQLPGFGKTGPTPTDADWTMLRHAQAQVASDLKDVGLVVTLDIGDPGNLHPHNKREVGRRLGASALAMTYGKDVAGNGPTYKSHEIKGSQLIVHFDNLHGGLVNTNGNSDQVLGFGLAGKDGKFVWADAVIQGDDVVVSSSQITSPVHVSYGWDAYLKVSLANKAGLPAAPFSTAAK